MGTHSSNTSKLNRTLKASMPSMSNFDHLGNASYNTWAHQNTALPIAPITASNSICSRCKDRHDPNCWVHNLPITSSQIAGSTTYPSPHPTQLATCQFRLAIVVSRQLQKSGQKPHHLNSAPSLFCTKPECWRCLFVQQLRAQQPGR